MRIGVHRLRYIRVAEHLLGYLGMSSPGQQDRGESMAEEGDSTEPILDWVRRYGVLESLPNERSGTKPQGVKSFRQSVSEAAGVLAMYEVTLNADRERAKSLVLEEFPFLGPA